MTDDDDVPLVNLYLLTNNDLSPDEIEYLAAVQKAGCCFQNDNPGKSNPFALESFLDDSKAIAFRKVVADQDQGVTEVTDELFFQTADSRTNAHFQREVTANTQLISLTYN